MLSNKDTGTSIALQRLGTRNEDPTCKLYKSIYFFSNGIWGV